MLQDAQNKSNPIMNLENTYMQVLFIVHVLTALFFIYSMETSFGWLTQPSKLNNQQ